MKKVNLVLIGAGSRSRAYTQLLVNHPDAALVGVVEPDEGRRKLIVDLFHMEPQMTFSKEEEFFNQGKIENIDAVMITTMDREHHRQAIKAIDCGYDILLEKPIALTAQDCLDILNHASQKGTKIMVCHVLRYAPFFFKLKEIITSGQLGKVISVVHNENICVFHFSHSYVRGSWRKASEASPIILAKSCHDFDLLTWLIDSKCKSISSFGSLSYFKEQNAPADSGKRCCDCPVKDDCVFNAEKVYLEGYWWNKGAVNMVDQSDEGICSALKTGPYGRCVFRCDNDVCDHQVAAMEFDNGVTAVFSLSAFTNPCTRTIKIMCEKGEIRGNMETIEVLPFAKEPVLIKMSDLTDNFEGHGGGDGYLLDDFISLVNGGESMARTSLDQSVQSHLMAFAAEQSRISGNTVHIDDFVRQLSY